MPEVHGHSKPLDPNVKPEHDKALKAQVFTPSVNPGVSAGIPSISAARPSVPRAIPPVQLPIKYIPPTPPHVAQTPKKTPQISTARITPGSFTPVGGGPIPSKGLITPTPGSTPSHIP